MDKTMEHPIPTVVSDDYLLAARLLKLGSQVAIPTETVYGLAANAFDEDAVKGIFKLKNRPFYDPLILHTDRIEKLEEWGIAILPELQVLADKFWPGPLTLLVDKPKVIPKLVTAGLPRVAVRIPNHPLTLKLLSLLDFPVAAPSANPFGFVSPSRSEHVHHHFAGRIPMILDGGPCEVGIESTIVGLENGKVTIYRLGGIAKEEIEALIGAVDVKLSSSKPQVPGQLVRHYSPSAKVVVVDTQREMNEACKEDCAVICFDLDPPENIQKVFKLSRTGDYKEAAKNFYHAMRSWENDKSVETIVIERLPDLDLGRAINDRLRRAGPAS